jgi:hypothetical protein
VTPTPRIVRGIRLDLALLLAGAAALAVGSFLPWIEGSTRLNGRVDWNGFDDTSEGLMIITAALAIVAWIRWRDLLAREVSHGTRWIPLALAVSSLLLWIIAFQKVLYLSWFEIEVGARPQVGMLVVGLGALLALAGGALAATDPDAIAAARASADRDRRRSGAGGDGAASSRIRRGGGGRPPAPGGYSVVGRVDRSSGRPDGGGDDGPARG